MRVRMFICWRWAFWRWKLLAASLDSRAKIHPDKRPSSQAEPTRLLHVTFDRRPRLSSSYSRLLYVYIQATVTGYRLFVCWCLESCSTTSLVYSSMKTKTNIQTFLPPGSLWRNQSGMFRRRRQACFGWDAGKADSHRGVLLVYDVT